MRIKLSRDEFLRQLNFGKRGELGEYVYFDGVPIGHNEITDKNALLEDYPALFNVLSAKERQILREMYESVNQFVPANSFFKFLENALVSPKNTFAVHVKNMRRKLLDNHIPLEIETKRGTWGETGMIRIVKK